MPLRWAEILAKYQCHGVRNKFKWIGIPSVPVHFNIWRLGVVGLWEVHSVGDDTPHAEMQRGQSDAGRCLPAAPGSICSGQCLLKSQRWKIGRAQAVASMWAPSWIDRPATYLPCRACRREALACGNGVTIGIHLSCQCLNPGLGMLVELEAGNSWRFLCRHCGGCSVTGNLFLCWHLNRC